MGVSSSDPFVPRLEAIYEKGNKEQKNYLGSLKLYCQEKNPKIKYKFKTSKFPGFNLNLLYKSKSYVIEERFDGTEAAVMYNGDIILRILKEN